MNCCEERSGTKLQSPQEPLVGTCFWVSDNVIGTSRTVFTTSAVHGIPPVQSKKRWCFRVSMNYITLWYILHMYTHTNSHTYVYIYIYIMYIYYIYTIQSNIHISNGIWIDFLWCWFLASHQGDSEPRGGNISRPLSAGQTQWSWPCFCHSPAGHDWKCVLKSPGLVQTRVYFLAAMPVWTLGELREHPQLRTR